MHKFSIIVKMCNEQFPLHDLLCFYTELRKFETLYTRSGKRYPENEVVGLAK